MRSRRNDWRDLARLGDLRDSRTAFLYGPRLPIPCRKRNAHASRDCLRERRQRSAGTEHSPQFRPRRADEQLAGSLHSFERNGRNGVPHRDDGGECLPRHSIAETCGHGEHFQDPPEARGFRRHSRQAHAGSTVSPRGRDQERRRRDGNASALGSGFRRNNHRLDELLLLAVDRRDDDFVWNLCDAVALAASHPKRGVSGRRDDGRDRDCGLLYRRDHSRGDDADRQWWTCACDRRRLDGLGR